MALRFFCVLYLQSKPLPGYHISYGSGCIEFNLCLLLNQSKTGDTIERYARKAYIILLREYSRSLTNQNMSTNSVVCTKHKTNCSTVYPQYGMVNIASLVLFRSMSYGGPKRAQRLHRIYIEVLLMYSPQPAALLCN